MCFLKALQLVARWHESHLQPVQGSILLVGPHDPAASTHLLLINLSSARVLGSGMGTAPQSQHLCPTGRGRSWLCAGGRCLSVYTHLQLF